MNTSYFHSCFGAISRTEFFATQGFLSLSKFGSVFGCQTRIVNFKTTVGNKHMFNANINTNGGIRFWQNLIIKFTQARYKISSCTVFSDCDGTWLAWQMPRPTNIKRLFAFGNKKLTVCVFKSTFGKFSRLLVSFLFECWVFRACPQSERLRLNGLKMAKFCQTCVKWLVNIAILPAPFSLFDGNLSHFYHHFQNEDTP